MTNLEFSNEFDIRYNSIASNAAPNLDLYEKSVYLTRAQLQIIKNYFNPLGNKYQDGFEASSKRRNDLNQLIKGATSVTEINLDEGISTNSQFFRINNDVFIILQEKAEVSNSDKCVNGTEISVKVKTHDEYNNQKDNPFKRPDKSVIWRLDYQDQGIYKNVELISPYTITKYKYRYVQYPSPIILTDLLTEFPDESLSIDNITSEVECALSPSIHPEILDRAVELATADYRKEDLAAKVQINNRNE